jgi:hypothetical protein
MVGETDIFFPILEPLQLLVRVKSGGMTGVATDAAGKVITQPEPPSPCSAVFLELSAADPAIAEVLRLLSAPDAMTWVSLFRIHEVIEDDVEGQHKLERKGWGSADDLRRFKHSANSVQVGGDKSRHGKESLIPPKNPMTLAEAEAYAKYIVQAWFASKGA